MAANPYRSVWWGGGMSLMFGMAGLLAVDDAVAAVPLMAQAGQVIVAKPMNELAKPAAGQQPGGQQPGAPEPAAAASGGVPAGLVKYAPSYALIVLFVGLGVFIVARPSLPFKKKDEKKK